MLSPRGELSAPDSEAMNGVRRRPRQLVLRLIHSSLGTVAALAVLRLFRGANGPVPEQSTRRLLLMLEPQAGGAGGRIRCLSGCGSDPTCTTHVGRGAVFNS